MHCICWVVVADSTGGHCIVLLGCAVKNLATEGAAARRTTMGRRVNARTVCSAAGWHWHSDQLCKAQKPWSPVQQPRSVAWPTRHLCY